LILFDTQDTLANPVPIKPEGETIWGSSFMGWAIVGLAILIIALISIAVIGAIKDNLNKKN
ncbi:MAG: hypothetical protein ACYC0V_15555, partial [Armatimonadota bacterium]